jgi:hypothetical protein
MRWIMVAIGATALGGFLGGVVADATVPSREQMRTWAAALVPPAGQTINVGELSGLEMFVGPYEAYASFQSYGIDVDVASEGMLAHGAELGWQHIETDVRPGGHVQRWTREEANASIYIFNADMSAEGVVWVRYPHSPADRFIVGSIIGALVGLVATVVVRRIVHRRST